MKKCFAWLLALMLALSAATAMAQGRTPPEDKKLVTTTDVGPETVFRKYDAKFWDKPSEQPGTVEKLSYTTQVYGEPVDNWMNVYLPYGYDAAQPYRIMYFFHGTNETQDSFIGDERVKNCLDNMIETGVAEPFILVCPTYYYDYETRATDKDLFCQELRSDIMPLVESTYHTYAPTPDDAGFAASRDYRAMAGYSQGSHATWVAFGHLLDTARWWLPLSGTSDVETVKAAVDAQPEYRDAFFIYMGCGGPRDMAYQGIVPFVKDMIAAEDYFSFGTDPEKNNCYLTISTEVHQTLISRYYLYNAFKDVLFQQGA